MNAQAQAGLCLKGEWRMNLVEGADRRRLVEVFVAVAFERRNPPSRGIFGERKFSLQERYKFSVKRGGIVCPRCQPQQPGLLPLSNGTIRIFQQAQNLNLLKIHRLCFSQTAHDEGKLIFGKFLEYHIGGRRPRSLDILEQLL